MGCFLGAIIMLVSLYFLVIDIFYWLNTGMWLGMTTLEGFHIYIKPSACRVPPFSGWCKILFLIGGYPLSITMFSFGLVGGSLGSLLSRGE